MFFPSIRCATEIYSVCTLYRLHDPECPLADEWIKKMQYICSGILLSCKRRGNNAICSNIDEPRDYHTE